MNISERLDTFNYELTKREISGKIQLGPKQVAVNLKQTRFLSLPVIKLLSEMAEDLSNTGGQMALVTPSEKLKRQFRIYASLSPCVFSRSEKDCK